MWIEETGEVTQKVIQWLLPEKSLLLYKRLSL